MITRYEVCTTCRCALANDDCTAMDDKQYAAFQAFTWEHGWFVTTDEIGLGETCEACGYTDYDATFYIAEEHHGH